MLRRLFPHTWPLVGVVHVPALPGSPEHRLTNLEIRDWVARDARTLIEAGFDGLIVENYGDRPFLPDNAEPHTVAALALLTAEVRSLARELRPEFPPAVGVNVLRNDAKASMGIAAMAGADFVRVNVHTGTMLTDQGILQGRAHETLRYRKLLGADVAVFADVFVKHAVPLGAVTLETAAGETYRRGGADVLVVTGPSTGVAADTEHLARVRAAVPEASVFVGSGCTVETLLQLVGLSSGAIVGTALKVDGMTDAPIDPDRARAMAAARDRISR